MSGYVFISNSVKPSKEKQESRERIVPDNISRPCLQAALEMGYEVYFGVNRKRAEELECELPVHLYDSNTYGRCSSAFEALKEGRTAYRNLCRLIEEEGIDVIHCNTPVGGVIGRLAGRKYHVKKVIYTAHGFHFFRKAPLFHRTVLKWAEQLMAHWTDVIITINQEDYEAAKRFRLKRNGKVCKIHGVGINLEEYEKMPDCREAKRRELKLEQDETALISVGDLAASKGYETALRAVAEAGNKKLKYFICGDGAELERLQALAKDLKIERQVHFLGFRTDVKELLQASDIYLFPTQREGLPRSLMEAMASGLPCVVSEIRGNVDLVKQKKGGILCPVKDSHFFAAAVSELASDEKRRSEMGRYNRKRIRKYDIAIVEAEIRKIYKKVLEDLRDRDKKNIQKSVGRFEGQRERQV